MLTTQVWELIKWSKLLIKGYEAIFICRIFITSMLFVKILDKCTLFGHKQLRNWNSGRHLEGNSHLYLLLSPNLQVYFSVVWQVWNYLRVATWTNRTEELLQDMECLFCFCFVSRLDSEVETSFFCTCWSKQKAFSWQQMSLHEKNMRLNDKWKNDNLLDRALCCNWISYSFFSFRDTCVLSC